MRQNRAKEGEEMAGRLQQVREAAREQEQKYEAEKKKRQAEIEGMIDRIQTLQEQLVRGTKRRTNGMSKTKY